MDHPHSKSGFHATGASPETNGAANTPISQQDLKRLYDYLSSRIIGQSYLLERLLVGLLTGGHLLLEGVPGLAKTRALKTLADAIDTSMNRIQFTPDLLPSDVLGTEVFRPQTGTFEIRKGPIFTNILLADEINRAPAKVQSALLEAMQERTVTLGEETYTLPKPFFVLATQNPIEQEGTYRLPEAQLDRFLMKVVVGYPSYEDELKIVQLVAQEQLETEEVPKIISGSALPALRNEIMKVYLDEKIDRYIVALVHETRKPKDKELASLIEWGASPRASIALRECARTLSYLRGKEFVTPDEVKDIAPDVLRHRILPGFEAEARDITSDDIISSLMKQIAVP